MKFGQLKNRNSFLQKSCRKWAVKLVPDILLFSRNGLYKVKASGMQLSFKIF